MFHKFAEDIGDGEKPTTRNEMEYAIEVLSGNYWKVGDLYGNKNGKNDLEDVNSMNKNLTSLPGLVALMNITKNVSGSTRNAY